MKTIKLDPKEPLDTLKYFIKQGKYNLILECLAFLETTLEQPTEGKIELFQEKEAIQLIIPLSSMKILKEEYIACELVGNLIYSALQQKDKENANQFISTLLLPYKYYYNCERAYVYHKKILGEHKTYSGFTLLVFSLMINNYQAFYTLLEYHTANAICHELRKGNESGRNYGENSWNIPSINLDFFAWRDRRIKVNKDLGFKIAELKKNENHHHSILLSSFQEVCKESLANNLDKIAKLLENIILQLPIMGDDIKQNLFHYTEFLQNKMQNENIFRLDLIRLTSKLLKLLDHPLPEKNFILKYTDLNAQLKAHADFILKIIQTKKIKNKKKIGFIENLWEKYSDMLSQLYDLFMKHESYESIMKDKEQYTQFLQLFFTVFESYEFVFIKVEHWLFNKNEYVRLAPYWVNDLIYLDVFHAKSPFIEELSQDKMEKVANYNNRLKVLKTSFLLGAPQPVTPVQEEEKRSTASRIMMSYSEGGNFFPSVKDQSKLNKDKKSNLTIRHTS